MKKIITNVAYQGLFQLVKIIMPMITIPIVANALGPTGIGTYNYTGSIVGYFLLFAGLGIPLYGSREIATKRDSKIEMSRLFWEIEIFSVLISGISMIIFLIFATFSNYKIIYYLQAMLIFSSMLDISWFFRGIEDFKKITLANLLVSILTFIMIILFVKKSSDIYIYVGTMTFGTVISQMVLWLFIFKKISFVKVTLRQVISHFKNIGTYFIPQVGMTVYLNMNRTILGLVIGTTAVGFFSNANIIPAILAQLILTVDSVMLPKLTYLYSKGENEKIFKLWDIVFNFQLFITIPIMVGLILVVPKLVPWFFGPKFSGIEHYLMAMSLLVVIIPMGSAISRQYLIPIGNMKYYNLSVVVGAIISLIVNLSLIPFLGIWGAVIGTLVAETFVTVTRVIKLIKETGFKYKWIEFLKYLIASIIMFVITRAVTVGYPSGLVTNIVQSLIGATIYLIVTIMIKANPIMELIKKRKY
ncbi:oligosaccharide flippase family protein [Dellaglioa sp. BT-FLS60]